MVLVLELVVCRKRMADMHNKRQLTRGGGCSLTDAHLSVLTGDRGRKGPLCSAYAPRKEMGAGSTGGGQGGWGNADGMLSELGKTTPSKQDTWVPDAEESCDKGDSFTASLERKASVLGVCTLLSGGGRWWGLWWGE